MKTRWKVIIGLIGLVALDQALTHYADYRIRSRHADFFERYAEVKDELDWNGDTVQACAFRYELLIYPYETCFKRGWGNPELGHSFAYAYSHPRPRLAIIGRGDTPRNYYFSNLGGNEPLIQVTVDGQAYEYDTGEKLRNEQN